MPKRDSHRRRLEYLARCKYGQLRDKGWPDDVAVYAALYYVGAKSLEWLKTHFKPWFVELVIENKPKGDTTHA